MRAIQDSYRECLSALPAWAEEIASALPFRIGLTERPEGPWEDFITLDVDRALPFYAADETVDPARIERFVRAHHAAGFYGVLQDRIDDGQVSREPELIALASLLRRHWWRALAGAIEDPRRARAMVAQAVRRMRYGTRLEMRMRRERGDARLYGQATALKLDWVMLAARALLLYSSAPARAASFCRAYRPVLVALQVLDDIADADEDRALHGATTAGALEVSQAALERAAVHLFRRATGDSREAGFPRLSAWLEKRFAHAGTEPEGGSRKRQNDLQGLLVSWLMHEGMTALT